MRDADIAAKIADAMTHLRFACKLYKRQVQKGRFFLHERPHTASSWNEDDVREVMNTEGVLYVRSDQCEAGQTEQGLHSTTTSRVRATTGWLTNSEQIAEKLSHFSC